MATNGPLNDIPQLMLDRRLRFTNAMERLSSIITEADKACALTVNPTMELPHKASSTHSGISRLASLKRVHLWSCRSDVELLQKLAGFTNNLVIFNVPSQTFLAVPVYLYPTRKSHVFLKLKRQPVIRDNGWVIKVVGGSITAFSVTSQQLKQGKIPLSQEVSFETIINHPTITSFFRGMGVIPAGIPGGPNSPDSPVDGFAAAGAIARDEVRDNNGDIEEQIQALSLT